MKTTCLFAALSGLAMAQEPAPGPPPMHRVHAVQAVPATPGVPGVPGMPAEFAARTVELGRLNEKAAKVLEAARLDEPLTWSFHQGQGRFHDVMRSGPMGFMGVNAIVLPRELSAHLSLAEDTGLLVEVVAKDSPADKGGLQANDVLAKLDDQILIDPRQFSVLVANKKEGDTVKITYIRKGETHEASVVIGKREGGAPAVGKAEADVLFKHTDGAPLRTFVRRFEMPGGQGEVRIVGEDGEDGAVRVIRGSAAATARPPGAPPVPPNEDVKKQLEEIRAMLEALQQKVK
jgi:membrane-associated protease RseP (regulator of RpoE activity)